MLLASYLKAEPIFRQLTIIFWWMEVITMNIVVGEYFRNMIPFSKPDEWNLDTINNAINTIKFIKCKCERSHQCLEVRNLTTT